MAALFFTKSIHPPVGNYLVKFHVVWLDSDPIRAHILGLL